MIIQLLLPRDWVQGAFYEWSLPPVYVYIHRNCREREKGLRYLSLYFFHHGLRPLKIRLFYFGQNIELAVGAVTKRRWVISGRAFFNVNYTICEVTCFS